MTLTLLLFLSIHSRFKSATFTQHTTRDYAYIIGGAKTGSWLGYFFACWHSFSGWASAGQVQTWENPCLLAISNCCTQSWKGAVVKVKQVLERWRKAGVATSMFLTWKVRNLEYGTPKKKWLPIAEMEIRLWICQDIMSRQIEFWPDIFEVWSATIVKV